MLDRSLDDFTCLLFAISLMITRLSAVAMTISYRSAAHSAITWRSALTCMRHRNQTHSSANAHKHKDEFADTRVLTCTHAFNKEARTRLLRQDMHSNARHPRIHASTHPYSCLIVSAHTACAISFTALALE